MTEGGKRHKNDQPLQEILNVGQIWVKSPLLSPWSESILMKSCWDKQWTIKKIKDESWRIMASLKWSFFQNVNNSNYWC